MPRRTAQHYCGRIRFRLAGAAWEGWRGLLRYGRDRRGVASIEMALIFPVMLIVFVGLVDVANLLTANRRVTLTATTLGDLVTQSTGAVKTTELAGFFSAAKPIMGPTAENSVTLEFYAFSNSTGTPKREWYYTSSGEGPDCGDEPVPNTELMTESNELVISRTCYAWQPVLGIVLGFSNSIIQDQIMLRPRQTARIVCDDCPK